MSTLRFRFWDDKNKTWLKENNYAINGDGIVYCTYNNVAEMMPKHVIPIQSTGLLDKNGVEIYEGDIVKMNTHCGEQIDKIESIKKH